MTRLMAGIYKITNNATGHIYIGQSQNVYEREIEHFTALRRRRHPNKMMQKEWNKSNRGFRFDVIEMCPVADLNDREKYWIDTLNTMEPNGFNKTWVPYKRKREIKHRRIKKYHRTR